MKIFVDYFGGEPTNGGEAVPGEDELSTELRLGRSASSIDIERDKRPKPTKPASIGKPDTKEKEESISIFFEQKNQLHKPIPCRKNCIDLAKTSG
jgi:hypothetical protein